MSDHEHTHVGARRGRLAVAFGITTSILLAEAVGSIVTGSLALLVDAAHMLTDAAGLGLALFATQLSRRPATDHRTWGFARIEALAALAQASLLLGVGFFTLFEAAQRLLSPPEIASGPLLVFGVIGLAGNVASIAVLAGDRSSTLNLRAAFLEVLGDAIGSLGVIAAAVVVSTTGWTGADAVAAVLIGVLIIPRAFAVLHSTVDVLLETTPTGVDLAQLREHLMRVPGVIDVHDLHASLIASELPVLTAHVVVHAECFSDGTAPRMLDQLQACVAEHFPVSFEHSTFQLEPAQHQGHEHIEM